MKIEEAMVYLLATSQHGMKTEQIARELELRGLVPRRAGRGKKIYSGLTHLPKLRTARLHCPLLNFPYRHKFTTFVVQTLEQKTTLQI